MAGMIFKLRGVIRNGLILSFGLLSVLFLLAYFSTFITGPEFWGISQVVSSFIFPMLGVKVGIYGILKKRTTLELVLLNGIVITAGGKVVPEYVKSLPDNLHSELKNNGQ